MLKISSPLGLPAGTGATLSATVNTTVSVTLCAAFGVWLLLAGPAAADDNRIDTIRPDAPALAKYGGLSIGVKTILLTNTKQLDIVKSKAGDRKSTRLNSSHHRLSRMPSSA